MAESGRRGAEALHPVPGFPFTALSTPLEAPPLAVPAVRGCSVNKRAAPLLPGLYAWGKLHSGDLSSW